VCGVFFFWLLKCNGVRMGVLWFFFLSSLLVSAASAPPLAVLMKLLFILI
jgi:hypothetical protein